MTSWSEVSTPAELSMKSVLIRPPGCANSMRPRCVKPEVASLAGDLRAELDAVDRRWSFVRSPASAFDLGRRLDVGADPAVPQQVDRRLTIPPDQLRSGSSPRAHPAGSRARRGPRVDGVTISPAVDTSPPADRSDRS